MAEKEGGNVVAKLLDVIKLAYVITEKQKEHDTKLLDLTAEIRQLREHYMNLDREIGELKGKYAGIDDKLKVLEQTTIAQLYKVKDEMKDEQRKAVDEMKNDFYKIKSETLVELKTEFAETMAKLNRLFDLTNSSRNLLQLPASTNVSPDGSTDS